jgi:class 3 adenylate cyclase
VLSRRYFAEASLPRLVARHGLEKIKTIGDCYTAGCGRAESAPGPRAQGGAPGAGHARHACDLGGGRPARSRAEDRHQHRARRSRGDRHETLLYDLWGDAVNTASRMESHGTPGEIQISRMTYGLLKDEFAGDEEPSRSRASPVETRYLVGSRSDDARAEPGVCSEAREPSIRRKHPAGAVRFWSSSQFQSHSRTFGAVQGQS